MMLDLHTLFDATGSTSLIQPKTIPSNDVAVVAGVPIITDKLKATLVGYGAHTLIADTLKQVQMVSQDGIDPVNGENWNPSSTLIGYLNCRTNLPFVSAARAINVAQNTGAAKESTYTIDGYSDSLLPPQAPRPQNGSWFPTSLVKLTTVFSALTSQSYGTKALAPSNLPQAGTYIILGAEVTGLTDAAWLRFQHADFGSFFPGFPVVDSTNSALARGTVTYDRLVSEVGRQFVYLSEVLKQPVCPAFRLGANSSGLTFQIFDDTADTPTVVVHLAKVA